MMQHQQQFGTFLILSLLHLTAVTADNQQVYHMHQHSTRTSRTVECDVIIAGGSTASLGAAIASARRSVDNVICLTEPTDWLGGQMTSSGVSAIDFGEFNRLPQFQSASFADMMASLGEGDPGRCWVSTKCFLPLNLINGWINKTVSALPNLKIFYNTVVKRVVKSERLIQQVIAIQRTVKEGYQPWKMRLSKIISDWYSEEDSEAFTKETITFVAKSPRSHPIVIEATEYGDILALSEASYRIGLEYPYENSSSTLEGCGQCITYPFFMVSTKDAAPSQDVPNPGGSYGFNGLTFGRIWAYRRALGLSIGQEDELHLGEISQQNYGDGNDFCDGFVYLNKSETSKQLEDWQGGLNLASLASAEDRGWGWYHFYKGNLSQELQNQVYLGLSDVVGTKTGLTKVPYLRDSRRSVGLDGFLMTKKDQLTPAIIVDDALHSGINFSVKFHDSIAIGNYNSDIHRLRGCKWPKYADGIKILPFHIPFRALTNQDFDNLLVAGKSMAQTEAGNAGARLHPTEFLTGEAAGTASIMILEEGLSTRQIYERVSDLQQELEKFMPIYWDHPRKL